MQTQTNTQAFTAKAIDFYVKFAACRNDESAAYYKAQAEKYDRFASGALEAAPVVVAAPEVEAPKVQPVKVRCAHYLEIRRFMAAAKSAGLDTNAKARSRQAVGALLGRRIESRADLTGTEWTRATLAIRRRELSW
jgi:hypothetical protein